jgi:hypothetical protein
VQKSHAGDVVRGRLLPDSLDRHPVLVPPEGAQRDGFRSIEQIREPGPARFGHAPRPRSFAPDAVAETRLLLDNEDTQAASGKHPTKGRAGNAATDDNDVKDCRDHRWVHSLRKGLQHVLQRLIRRGRVSS